ncbi:helix-turn-helix domain-containing protein [Hathewaya histolytica]|uniref:Putative replication initiation and membrane attachment n=1 Tax=Hathewaya histolytica TaxID=1498 RepID=A0A4U9RBA8_HATHI|nr:helix-turn-helix domain-containing protein [Hathewaya histolytica]VTQ88436.1 putative replication initiation and membrane attachment [Hathewaya histolytica]
MTVFRTIKDKENPYIMLNKYFIYDSRLSLKAKGLMSYFLSRPDHWEFYQIEILQHCKDKKDSLSNTIKELEKRGYVKRILRRDQQGKLMGGYDYEVYEIPDVINKNEEACTNISDIGKTETGEIRNREKPISENPPLVINDSLVINECSSRNDVQKVIDHYCSKASILETNLKPIEFSAVIKLIEDEVPLKLINQGIDLAFKKFRPSFDGDKIKSFKYCEPVIRGLWAKELVKKEGVNNEPSRSSDGEELREQGIGL